MFDIQIDGADEEKNIFQVSGRGARISNTEEEKGHLKEDKVETHF